MLAAVVGVAAAVAGNQILNGRVLEWRWVPVAIVLTGLLLWLSELAFHEPKVPLATQDDHGLPLPLREVRLTDLGVHPTDWGADGRSPYVPRDVDDELREAVRGMRVLVAHGPRLAGTSRAVAEAVTHELPGWRVVVPEGGSTPAVGLADLIRGAKRWARDGVVVWLEQPHAMYLNQLDEELVNSVPPGMLVCLMCDSTLVDSPWLAAEAARLLRDSDQHRHVVKMDTLSSRERERVVATPPYQSLRQTLESRQPWWTSELVSWQRFSPSPAPKVDETPARLALLQAVTDWQRLQMPTPLTEPILRDLYREYVREATGENADDEMFDDARTWAHHHDPPLVDRVSDRRGVTWYVPHPMMEVADTMPANPRHRPISEVLYRFAERQLTEADRRTLGLACLDRGDEVHAKALLHRLSPNSLSPATQEWLAGEQPAAAVNYEWPRPATRSPDRSGSWWPTEPVAPARPERWWVKPSQ